MDTLALVHTPDSYTHLQQVHESVSRTNICHVEAYYNSEASQTLFMNELPCSSSLSSLLPTLIILITLYSATGDVGCINQLQQVYLLSDQQSLSCSPNTSMQKSALPTLTKTKLGRVNDAYGYLMDHFIDYLYRPAWFALKNYNVPVRPHRREQGCSHLCGLDYIFTQQGVKM